MSVSRILTCLAVLVAVFAWSPRVLSQGYYNLSSVHDGSGVMSSNAVYMADGHGYTNVSAAGQPGGIAISSGGGYTNYAGFLQAVDIKRPGLDTDGDGVIDEIAQDNDGDTLSDTAEVEGSGFDPVTTTSVNNPDSDDDGASDGAEAIAGTNPQDEDANLHILAIRDTASGREVTYFARADKEYHIRAEDGSFPPGGPQTDLGTDSEAGGAGAWNVRTNTFSDAAVTNARFYGVEARRP